LRAQCYLEKGELDKAMADTERAIHLAPKYAYPYTTRGRINYKRRRWQASAADYAKAVEVLPNSSYTLNALAWFQATCPERAVRDGKAAVKDGLKACRITSWRDADYVDTLAAAYAETGDFQLAAKYQAQALRGRHIAPEDRPEMEARLTLYQQRKPYRELRD
jgi:tetratricopeptide (TPR) repeat protein